MRDNYSHERPAIIDISRMGATMLNRVPIASTASTMMYDKGDNSPTPISSLLLPAITERARAGRASTTARARKAQQVREPSAVSMP